MARPLRVEYAGAFYHVTARGDKRNRIYRQGRDYLKFKSFLKNAQEKYGYLLHCYVLMGNHYHLLIGTPEPNLSEIMTGGSPWGKLCYMQVVLGKQNSRVIQLASIPTHKIRKFKGNRGL